ncbi:MAG: bacillithiol transferase BstA [Acidobacteriota bacterium]|nr:bacillithiol transferase BstA [Acidobacteriota bacterium]
MSEDLESLRYPIGQFEPPSRIDEGQIERWISDIETLPADLRRIVTGLTETQLDTPYRPGGWTIRQVIHHLPDSHMNSFIRFKWALTEDRPKIKAYFEDRWAELPDYAVTPVLTSLDLLEALHRRWVALLRSLTRQDLDRTFNHPESGPANLAETIGSYAWHGRHHLAHIRETIRREGWNC